MAKPKPQLPLSPASDNISPPIGALVWFADRTGGRTTEHIARVVGVVKPGVLQLLIHDQGADRIYDHVAPWGGDPMVASVQGWWRA